MCVLHFYFLAGDSVYEEIFVSTIVSQSCKMLSQTFFILIFKNIYSYIFFFNFLQQEGPGLDSHWGKAFL